MHRDDKLLASILEAMQDGVCIIKDDYTVVFMNKIMTQSFGEGTGERCYRVLNRRDDVCPWCRAEEVLEGNTIRWESYLLSFRMCSTPI